MQQKHKGKHMEKNIVIPAREMNISAATSLNMGKKVAAWCNNVKNIAMKPMVWLQKYYSKVLEKEVSLKQTWLLLKAQGAFFMMAYPTDSCPLLLRAFFLVLFVWTLLRCKEEKI